MEGPAEDYQEFIARQVHATLSLFDLSPSKFPFDERRITKIRERRKQLNGTLFIDYMLSQAGIVEPTKVFPPTNPEELKFLITSVYNGEWGLARSANVNEWSQDTATSTREKDLTAGIKRACVVYYLLAWWEDRPNLRYSEQQRISSQFVELTHAYFLMDIGNTAGATSLLCTPLITPEPVLSEKIFQTLALAADADPNVLILRYARMAKPPLASETVLTLFVTALAKVNFVEAWNHQRTYEEDLRKDLLKVIFSAILSPRLHKKALHLLSSVPLQPLERDFLHKYALNPMPLGPKTPLEMHESSLAALQSLIILRLTQEGDYTTAVRLNREFSQQADNILNGTDSIQVFFTRSELDHKNYRPGFTLAQKAEEWREMLRESIALLPLEHRRVLESKLNEGGPSATSSFANPSKGTQQPANGGMEMSWETVDSSPPRPVASSPVQPAATLSADPLPLTIPTTITPSHTRPSSPQKKSPLVTKSSQQPSSPIETQTLGRIAKVATPRRRSDHMSYLTPLKTPFPMVPSPMAGGVPAVTPLADLGRSGAPPPTTGRAVNKNAFFDPDVRAVKGLVLDSATESERKKKAALKGDKSVDDVEMRDADGDETEEEDAQPHDEGADGDDDDSFVIAPPPSSSVLGFGGLVKPSTIVAIKKMQERERDKQEKVREAQERQAQLKAQRSQELAARRAMIEQQRRSLGGNDSSFSSVGAGAGGGGKRKRDRDDNMGRSDEENDDAGVDTDRSLGFGKRKSDGGVAQLVRKNVSVPAPAPVAVPTAPAMSTRSAASRSTRSGALVPPTTHAPSITSGGAMATAQEATSPVLRRSSRISSNDGSAAGDNSQAGGSVRGPSPSPDPTEHGDSEDHEGRAGSPQMPGAFVLDQNDGTDDSVDETKKTRTRRTTSAKGGRSATASPTKGKSTRAKPDSSKGAGGKKRPPNSTETAASSSARPSSRQTRSGRSLAGVSVPSLSVPTPIAEDAVLETVDEDEAPKSPSKSTRGATVARRAAKLSSAGEGTEGETDENAPRRTSRRLAAAGTAPEGSSTTTGGGRKSGRKV
ncbi:hypothetical protein CPB86DRAFT_789878 [Serendipita vermifera]|nr:hypothetical protein CPB86DRAFT_789878 [Serendipita vermifera]